MSTVTLHSPFTPEALQFLRELPQTTDTQMWCKEFRTVLMRLLGDVDHIVVNVYTTLNLSNPEEDEQSQFQVLRDSFDSASVRQRAVLKRQLASTERWRDILEDGRHNGFPLEKYQEAIGFDYLYQEKTYCGSILLFRSIHLPPISEETLQLLEEMKAFIAFLFSDHIARYQATRPHEVAFPDLVKRVRQDVELTSREEEILLLLITGFSYDDMADTLCVSRSTVNSHIASLYQKLGVKSVKAIFSRYMTPRNQ
ncbi:MAG: LuxR C-terminal-related transcriptional regulator [Candidatus Kapaibacterium sp.]